MKKNQEAEEYVIGVDGGGTKTVAALANLEGKVLRLTKVGPSSPRNVGIKTAAKNIAEALGKIAKKEKIRAAFIGLPALEEEYKFKKEEIKREILKQKGISSIFKEKPIIGSDQLIAFRSGSDDKNGVLLIAGTGCVAHGWKNGKEVKVSGWGWLGDEGSAFWLGQKAFQAVFKELDGRGQKTLITKIAFKELKVKNIEDLLLKIYPAEQLRQSFSLEKPNWRSQSKLSYWVYSQNPTNIIPKFSIYCDKAGQRGDLAAKRILIEAAKELVLSANTVIKKLNFQRKKFPLVLVGSVFKSKIILDIVKKEIKKFAPKAVFILPRQGPVIGAIKLAIEGIKK